MEITVTETQLEKCKSKLGANVFVWSCEGDQHPFDPHGVHGSRCSAEIFDTTVCRVLDYFRE